MKGFFDWYFEERISPKWVRLDSALLRAHLKTRANIGPWRCLYNQEHPRTECRFLGCFRGMSNKSYTILVASAARGKRH